MSDRRPQVEWDVRTDFSEGLRRIWSQYNKVRDFSVVTMLVVIVLLISLDITLGFLVKAVSYQQSGTAISLIRLMFVFIFIPGTLVVIFLFARQWTLLSKENDVISAEIEANNDNLNGITTQAAKEKEGAVAKALLEPGDDPRTNGHQPKQKTEW